MLFHVYGEHALAQWGMMLLVLVALILGNEFARRTKCGGIITFGVIPAILTVYFLSLFVGVKLGADWALNNSTVQYMGGWFHYAKLYAALTGCIGFMLIKYQVGVGKKHWFRCFPFLIVAINILIAVVSDFEHAAKFWYCWGLTEEGVWAYGGWHNIMNGVAGILNIFCMTAWWNVYSSKDKKDMIWPDMTWVYIVVYDVWNFAYTYNCLPTHSWYCGIALLLAPTVAALLWNKGGWIQNRANTLTIWCMFAQCFPLFQEWLVNKGGAHNTWAALPTVYVGAELPMIGVDGAPIAAGTIINAPADPTAMTVVSALALLVNVIAITYIICQSVKRHINPYTTDVFVNQKYYKECVERAIID